MPNILLIEDNPGDALLLREMYRDADVVGDEYDIIHVTRVSEAIDLLKKRHDIDIIISDMSLPDSQGLETLNSLSKIASQLPVIFMTGTNNESLVSAAIKAGAQDYLVKGHIDSQVLTRTTAYSIERKKAQIEYENAMREVTDLAKSAELLEQQKQQLMRVSQAKDEFISLASHQLRTPATGVKQYLGMIIEGYAGEVPAYLQSYLRTAYNSNERQLSIIDDLLKTARIDSGNFTLSKTDYDICELIDEVIEEYQPITTIRKQEIIYKPDKPCRVKIDVPELKVAIANLVENASKYSPYESTIEIEVKHSKEQIKICVKDSGVGISKKDLTKIFDKFTRIDNELSDTVNGSGLGLYFVKRIVKMHHGTVNVTSELHEGSTFSVALPGMTATATKVLIVEDETMLSDVYKTVLAMNDYEVEVAANGLEGLQKIKAFDPHVILLDLLMPKMDGITMLSTLDPSVSRQKKIIVCSNLFDEPTVTQVKQLGACDLILKSTLSPAQLVELVNTYA